LAAHARIRIQDHNETSQAARVDMIKQSFAFLAKYNPA